MQRFFTICALALCLATLFFTSTTAQTTPCTGYTPEELLLARQNSTEYLAKFFQQDKSDFEYYYNYGLSFFTEDSGITVVGPGTFGGPDDRGYLGMLEYILILVPVYNGNRARVVGVNITDFEMLSADIAHVYFYVNTEWYIGSPAEFIDNITVADGNPEENAFDLYIEFEPCSPKIKFLTVDFTDFWGLMLIGSFPSHNDLCTTIMINCQGDNQQFDNLVECLAFFAQLPTASCAYPQGLAGNSSNCRVIHSFMTAFMPDVHCPHVGYNSEPCTNKVCKAPAIPRCPRCPSCPSCPSKKACPTPKVVRPTCKPCEKPNKHDCHSNDAKSRFAWFF